MSELIAEGSWKGYGRGGSGNVADANVHAWLNLRPVFVVCGARGDRDVQGAGRRGQGDRSPVGALPVDDLTGAMGSVRVDLASLSQQSRAVPPNDVPGSVRHLDDDLQLNEATRAQYVLERSQRSAAVAVSELLAAAGGGD